MGFLNDLFSTGPKVDVNELVKQGASVIDVRSPGEFAGGHPKGAKNIPLNQVGANMDKIKKMKQPVVCVCASGMRSGSATRKLKAEGIEAYNGGSWMALR